jgi:hypothetical protein
MMQDPVAIPPPGAARNLLHSLWGAFQQAFTVEDVFQRKIK